MVALELKNQNLVSYKRWAWKHRNGVKLETKPDVNPLILQGTSNLSSLIYPCDNTLYIYIFYRMYCKLSLHTQVSSVIPLYFRYPNWVNSVTYDHIDLFYFVAKVTHRVRLQQIDQHYGRPSEPTNVGQIIPQLSFLSFSSLNLESLTLLKSFVLFSPG